jgi:hypothetical protein
MTSNLSDLTRATAHPLLKERVFESENFRFPFLPLSFRRGGRGGLRSKP